MANHEKNDHVIGVDVGGTKIAAGFVNAAGGIGAVTRVRMISDGGAEDGVNAVSGAIDYLMEMGKKNQWAIRAIGICAPGPLDPNTGIIINPPNVPCWRNYPLGAEILRRYRLPVKIENDANAAALAEVLWGAGKGFAKVFYLSIGTGIGTGFILDGKIYNGRTGAAPEGGHVSIDYRGPVCSCGKRGCIEIYVSGPAIAKRAQARLESANARHAPILKLAGGQVAGVSCEVVSQANAAGDTLAKEILLETVDLLSVWLGNIIDLLEPDVIVVGGGVAAVLQPFFGDIRERLPGWCINSRAQEIPIVPAHYGADSGIAGGGALCQ
ncbi:MAG: ROK family protein [Acidobacteriota bacterium]|nr:ROK family protein [Acidobacteriota bacterium]